MSPNKMCSNLCNTFCFLWGFRESPTSIRFSIYFSLHFISDTQLKIKRKDTDTITDENKDSKHKRTNLFADVLQGFFATTACEWPEESELINAIWLQILPANSYCQQCGLRACFLTTLLFVLLEGSYEYLYLPPCKRLTL